MRQFASFVLIGCVNTAVYLGVYATLNRWIPYLTAHVIGYTVSIVCSFLLNSYVTCRTRPTWQAFVRYPLSSLVNLVASGALLYGAVSGLGMDKNLAALAAGVLVTPVSFLLARWAITSGRTRADAAREAKADAGAAEREETQAVAGTRTGQGIGAATETATSTETVTGAGARPNRRPAAPGPRRSPPARPRTGEAAMSDDVPATATPADRPHPTAPGPTGRRGDRARDRDEGRPGSRSRPWTALWVTALALPPLALLAAAAWAGRWVRPGADDWCFLPLVRDEGVAGLVGKFYLDDNGRLANALLVGAYAKFQVAGHQWFPLVSGVLVVAVLWVVAVLALRRAGLRTPRGLPLLTAAMTTALFLFATPNTYKTFYWPAASVSHTLPPVLACAALIPLLLARSVRGRRSPWPSRCLRRPSSPRCRRRRRSSW